MIATLSRSTFHVMLNLKALKVIKIPTISIIATWSRRTLRMMLSVMGTDIISMTIIYRILNSKALSTNNFPDGTSTEDDNSEEDRSTETRKIKVILINPNQIQAKCPDVTVTPKSLRHHHQE
ncbi:uncharacterized protein LOC131670682 [Phymastichus coffea]|uniref:uncharacterized protein LOC131670682 n=1 Tax=Phymastichus coffea TaxID=108790 RepID=UPI00273CEA07|nr:uncharacterized protein LOC131670682 [Phymastichus coffea]